MRKNQNHLVIGCFVLFIIGSPLGFWAIANSNKSDNDIIFDTGKVVFCSFEGGFYGIVADDGSNYDPINLPDEFKIPNLLIEFIAKMRYDLVSYHMWGDIIELIYINYVYIY